MAPCLLNVISGGFMSFGYRFINKRVQYKAGSLLLLVSLALNIACTKDRLKPLTKALSGVYTYGEVDADFCTDAPSPAQLKIKYLFIIDHSASNQPGFPLTPNDITNTDYNGSRRYGPLVNFIQNLQPDPNNITFFNVINFNDIAYQGAIMPALGSIPQPLPFESNAQTFINRITTHWIGTGTAAAPAPVDAGFTNYQAALSAALQRITADAQQEAVLPANPIVKSSYQIIFVTDGEPEVPLTPGPGTMVQTFNQLRPIIRNIIDLKNDPSVGPYIQNIVLNTAYYFNATPVIGAQTLLQQIANEGNGQYVEFGSGRNILYQQFAPPARTIRNDLIDVYVENKNGLYWDNGQFMLDSDGEGLPDQIELQYGSNVNRPDSDGNGVSDLVEYRTKGRACDATNCNSIGRDRYAICAGFNPQTDAFGNVTFDFSTNDGFNDCEKYLLYASLLAYNTNGNLIPDQYAYKLGLPIIIGSGDAAFADPFGDGLTNYEKMKLGLPLQVSKNTLIDYDQREISLTYQGSPEPDVNCYKLYVRNIALSSINDTMRVMIVQNGSAVDDRPFLKQAERRLGQNQVAQFYPGDFR